jgi:acetolactate synthase-1/2/3 large subunit
MNGADSLVRTLLVGGLDTCFTNPGTSEMHMVAALDREPRMRCLLTLFEGVATGAADGYARMALKPACTLLHLGPGLANGVANLHNASRAHVPIVNVVGEHATFHLRYDAPLTSDIEGIAKPVSNWVKTSNVSSEVGRDTADAIAAARTAPGQIATLIVAADASWADGGIPCEAVKVASAPAPSTEVVLRTAKLLRSGLPTALLLAGDALYGVGLDYASMIAGTTGAKLLAPYPFTRLERGCGRAVVTRIPYIFEQAVELLKQFQQLILVGARIPVSYFAHPAKKASPVPDDCQVHTLAGKVEGGAAALEALAAELGADRKMRATAAAERPSLPIGAISATSIGNALGALLPDNAILIEESMTSGRNILTATAGCSPHDVLANTGGSIGIAMPMAVGASTACPERRVICLSADGSGMYTHQALWSMARAGLRVTTVIFANREYGVLKREFGSLGLGELGHRTKEMFEIGRPDIDWVALAKGMGVPGSRPRSMEEFARDFRGATESDGPALIQVDL